MRRKLLIIFIVLIVMLVVLSACVDVEAENKIKGIQVGSFNKTVYYKGNSLDLSGATILVTYEDNQTMLIPITLNMIKGYDSSVVGKQTIEIHYEKFIARIEVEVLPLVLTGVKLVSKETGKGSISIDILRGNYLDMGNYRLILYYEGNQESSIDRIDDSMISGYNIFTGVGTHTVYVNYLGFSDKLTVNVFEREIEQILVTNQNRPTKIEYFVGESLLPAGLKLTVYYTSGLNEVIAYSEENKDDFEFFDYEFKEERTLAAVRVRYKGEFDFTFTVSVRKPNCTTMRLSYVVDGIEIDGRPKTFAKTVNGVNIPSSAVDSILQGSLIDWSTGKAQLVYEDGTTEIISLDDNAVYKDGVYDLNTEGSYIIYLRYGSVSWRVGLNITVLKRTAHEIILKNTESVLKVQEGDQYVDRLYVSGTPFIIDPIKYNILYNDGKYEYYDTVSGDATIIDSNINNWANLKVNMLTLGSSLTLEHVGDKDQVYEQTIGLSIQNLTISLKVKVVAIKVAELKATAPTKNYYPVGTQVGFIDYNGGSLYVVYNNNVSTTLNLINHSTQDIDVVYTDLNGDIVDIFDTIGDYTATITYKDQTASYTLHVTEKNITSVTLATVPSSNQFINFESIDFSSMTYKVDYMIGGSSYTEYVRVSQDDIYLADKLKIGEQEITLRYQGALVKYVVDIVGRRTISISLKRAPEQTLYYLHEGIENALSLSGLRIVKTFNDNSADEEVNEFFSSAWSFEILNSINNAKSDLNTIGQKTVNVYYNAGHKTFKVSFLVFVEEDEVESINFNSSQLQNETTYSGQIIRYLTVQKYGDLNCFGLYLDINYAAGGMVSVPLLEGYVQYNSLETAVDEVTGQELKYRKLEIRFGGKIAYIWIYIDSERVLKSISIYRNPDKTDYPVGMDLTLEGGIIKRVFEVDGVEEVDYLSMTDRLISVDGYNANPFGGVSESVEKRTQSVTINYQGKSASLPITSYRKLDATGKIQYLDSVSFYGVSVAPSAIVRETVAGFVTPEIELFYRENGELIKIDSANGIYPKLPGTYDLIVKVVENEYYKAMTIEEAQCYIAPRYIEVRAVAVSKIYGDIDPKLTFVIQGDTVDEEGNPINTMLIYNDGVQDKLEIIIEREKGENVRYNSSGAIISYQITCRLASSSENNQNDRYNVAFTSSTFTINPKQIDGNIRFEGLDNLFEDGNPKYIMARIENSYVYIAESDIVYKDQQGNVLDKAPSAQGTYVVTISGNYSISGTSSATFYIRQQTS